MILPRALILTFLTAPALAQAFDPRYVLPGRIRIWGDPAMSSVVLTWEERFHLYHPEIVFTNQLIGTDTAMGALYTGLADLALLGREPNQTESDGFLHSLQYSPTRFRLLTGSLDVPDKSPAPIFFVSAENPITSLTRDQAAKALGNTHPPARTWGDLGITGPWARHPIHVYTCGLKTGTGVFLLNALQGRSQKMNWPIVHEFHDLRHDDGSTTTAAARTADALRADPDGLAVSTLRNAGPTIKALPFEGILPTPATLIDSAYPLTRATFAFLNRPPNQPPPQPVSEFLRFVFSPEGQSLVTGQPGFLPLSSTIAAEQAAALTPR